MISNIFKIIKKLNYNSSNLFAKKGKISSILIIKKNAKRFSNRLFQIFKIKMNKYYFYVSKYSINSQNEVLKKLIFLQGEEGGYVLRVQILKSVLK